MKVLIILAVITAIAGLSVAKVKRFDNFRVWRVTPNNAHGLLRLKALQESNTNYDFWTDVSGVNKAVDIMVAPEFEARFLETVKMHAINVELYIDDVQQRIDSSRPKNKSGKSMVDFKDYNTYEEINEWMTKLANDYEEVTLIEGGHSYEGRKILGVHVSFSSENENRAVFLEGGIHAREWIAVSTTMFQLNEILTSSDPAVRKMASNHDWYIFPVVNPDGYAYTFNEDRMWRKTRQPYGLCKGADPNRNWGFKWNEGGASSISCAENFSGSHAFSEIETQTLSEYINTIGHKLIAYIGHHSYSQYLLVPYGDSNEHRDNYEELMDIGRKAVDSLSTRYGTKFDVGNIVDLVYVATGSSMDWVKATFGVRLTYTYELRDTGRNGFILPADQIIPSGEEVLDALVTILDG